MTDHQHRDDDTIGASDHGIHRTNPKDNRPFWNRPSIMASAAAALALAAALVPMGPGAFAIAPGKGFIPTLSYDQSINLAEHCDTPLYMGRNQTPTYRITYDVARKLESETDRVQVTAGVREGQRFNYRRNFFGMGAWAGDACPTSEL